MSSTKPWKLAVNRSPGGNVATYIPELGKARKEALGLCVSLPDGTAYKVGDTNIRFTIQSISKVISLCKALEVRGVETVFSHVGMEPSGKPSTPLWNWTCSQTAPSIP